MVWAADATGGRFGGWFTAKAAKSAKI
jgi:hypothetical protein